MPEYEGRTGLVVVPRLGFGADMDSLQGSVRSTTLAVGWNGFSPSSATLTLGKLLNCTEPLHANKSNSSHFQSVGRRQ